MRTGTYKLSETEHDISQKEAKNANANGAKTKEEEKCENLSQELKSNFNENDNFTGENKSSGFPGLKRKNTRDSDTDSPDSTKNSYQDFEHTDSTTEENKKVDRSLNNPLVTDDIEGRDISDNREKCDENLPGEVRNVDLQVDVNKNVAGDRNSNLSGSCNSVASERSDSESRTREDSDIKNIRNDPIGRSSCGSHNQDVIELHDITKSKKKAVSREPNKCAVETDIETQMAENDSEELRVLDENENPKQGRPPEDSTDAAVNNNQTPKSNDFQAVTLAQESTDLDEGARLQVPSKDKDVEAGNIHL